ncbi:helix-turn-helix domain-containing protein [Zunongwangia atlantica]|uniref:AraC family transcriptional regulator n=1 Tax=Zunongwangia atlantica 22II14-10F7 TaxID=1185767 RepID=A0A1Y1T2F3_9FLAO|nr:AraC family transcriptional regulator [Zunongwangia atlantica]ORL44794.1 AraC family transcriptional regulator [Zunongwangia atlantica 22II14-10F7]
MHPFLEKVKRDSDSFFVHHTKIEEQLPMHSHNKHQMSYVEGGVAFLNTRNKSYFFPARHFIWIPAGREHNVISRTSVKFVRNIFFPKWVIPKDHKLQERGGIFPVTDLLMEMIYYTEKWRGDVTKKDKTQLEFLLALKNIVLDAAENPLPIVLPTTENETLRPILKYIHQHIDQPLYLDKIAEEFGQSSRTLSRLFQGNMETSFLQYVKLSRTIKSMEMLLQTDLSITEIAYSCGYNSLSAFSYAFQQIVHRSPKEFRKQTELKNKTS